MVSAELSRRAGKVVGYPPLSGLDELQRREFHEALLNADHFEDLPRVYGHIDLIALAEVDALYADNIVPLHDPDANRTQDRDEAAV